VLTHTGGEYRCTGLRAVGRELASHCSVRVYSVRPRLGRRALKNDKWKSDGANPIEHSFFPKQKQKETLSRPSHAMPAALGAARRVLRIRGSDAYHFLNVS